MPAVRMRPLCRMPRSDLSLAQASSGDCWLVPFPDRRALAPRTLGRRHAEAPSSGVQFSPTGDRERVMSLGITSARSGIHMVKPSSLTMKLAQSGLQRAPTRRAVR